LNRLAHQDRKKLIERNHPELSIATQAGLLGISRSSVYYESAIDPEDVKLTRLIDIIYTAVPFYGSRRIAKEIRRKHAIAVSRKRIGRLMNVMGIEAVYPKARKNTSNSDDSHKKYPYLLRGIAAKYPNHIWGTDITYIRLEHGWAYLVAIMDWHSRYVIAWELSPTLEIEFVLQNLNRALQTATPDIHNSDQGSHFTSPSYTDLLTQRNIQISMDGRGRCMDNIFTERLWRTVKYEEVYLKSYADIEDAKRNLARYFQFYNHERPHQALGYNTPAETYFGSENFKKIQNVENTRTHNLNLVSI
jgi:putative transposase